MHSIFMKYSNITHKSLNLDLNIGSANTSCLHKRQTVEMFYGDTTGCWQGHLEMYTQERQVDISLTFFSNILKNMQKLLKKKKLECCRFNWYFLVSCVLTEFCKHKLHVYTKHCGYRLFGWLFLFAFFNCKMYRASNKKNDKEEVPNDKYPRRQTFHRHNY